MTALKTEPITTGTTKKLSGNGRRGDLDGEGASILSTTPEWAFRGCGGGWSGAGLKSPARPTVNSAASLAVPTCSQDLNLKWLANNNQSHISTRNWCFTFESIWAWLAGHTPPPADSTRGSAQYIVHRALEFRLEESSRRPVWPRVGGLGGEGGPGPLARGGYANNIPPRPRN